MALQSSQSADTQRLHDLVEELADQLCLAVDGEFGFSVPRIHMTEIASGKSPETVALIELGRMR